MQSSGDPIEVFVFCWYPDGWLPRAVIVDYSKFDEQLKSDVQFLVQHGTLLEKMVDVKKYSERAYSHTLTGYRSNNIVYKMDESNERLRDIISTWTHYSDSLHMEMFDEENNIDENDWMNNAYEYFMNDGNGNLRPKKLHEVLSGMTSLPLSRHQVEPLVEPLVEPSADQSNRQSNEKVCDEKVTIFNSKISVKYCVLVSEISICDDEKKSQDKNKKESFDNDWFDMKPLRFFFSSSKLQDVSEDIKECSKLIVLKGTTTDDSITPDRGLPSVDPPDRGLPSVDPQAKIKKIIKEAFDIDSIQLSDKDYGFLTPKNQDQYNELVNSSHIVNYDSENNNVIVFTFI